MKIPVIVTTAALAACASTAFTADAVGLHPQPQKLRLLGGVVTLDPALKVAGERTADVDAVRLLKERVAKLGSAGGGTISEVVVGERGDAAVEAYVAGVPSKSGAYRIVVDGGRLVLAGHDGRGTFYAMQTLLQLLDADRNPADMPSVDIVDWPDIEFRGVVEGFYGIKGDRRALWTHEGRLSLLDFYGRHKLDTYIYGPKDDPFHSSPNWRKPYPEPDASRISELVRVARANKVNFVWAIHPGKDIKWNEEDFQNVKNKFQSMYGLGVRSFALFFDDISGEGTRAEKQAELLNRLHNEFVKVKGDVTPLVICPTQYNKSWSGGDYLDILGTRLDPSIHVMWTGNSVVADLDKASMEWINKRLRRKAYIWWNFPVNDFVRNHLLMGPVYGNTAEGGEMMSGFTSNPMSQSEASKIALFGVADYTWNLKQYDAQSAWNAAIRELAPTAADAFKVFCVHNSDLGPNGHGYRREESVDFGPVAQRLLAQFRKDGSLGADGQAARDELRRIAAAPAVIRAKVANEQLLFEMGPWLDAFEQLGVAGVSTLDAAAALSAKENAKVWPALGTAAVALARMAEIDRTENRNPYQPGIKTGTLVVTPMVTEIYDMTAARFMGILTGQPFVQPRGITSSSRKNGLDKLCDADAKSYYYCEEIQKVGDWYGVDLGVVQDVRRVRIAQGRNDNDHDRVHEGVLEGSVDGNGWEKLAADPVRASVADVSVNPPRKVRFVRIRSTHAGKLDGTKDGVWTAIRSFDVNPRGEARLVSNMAPFAQQPMRQEEGRLSVAPMLEVHSFTAKGILGIDMPAAVFIAKVVVDLQADSPARSFRIEASLDGKAWEPLKAEAEGKRLVAKADRSARAIRVINTAGSAVSVTLKEFSVELAKGAASGGSTAALSDRRLDTIAEVAADGAFVVATPDVPNPKGVVLLLSPADKGGVTVFAVTRGGNKVRLGDSSGALGSFKLPEGTTGIAVSSSASKTVRIHEVIWK